MITAGVLRSVDNHLAECLAALTPLPPVPVPLLEAAGCVLAEDVESPFSIPLFDNSSMDGYAVRMADVATAGEAPVTLPVTGDLPAGVAPELKLAPGTAIRIMTGAPMPAGAEAVVQVEWTDAGADQVTISRTPRDGANIRHVGDDVSAGERVLRSGTRLTARQVALLAAVGRDRVLAHPRPRVVVLPSGSELVPPGMPLSRGQIHDSNGYGLVAAAAELGALAEHGGVMGDDGPAVSAMLAQAAKRADLLVTSGGVSAGAYDTVKEVLSATGAVSFTKVAMQPGMPQGFGLIGDTPIFTLPGNPVSALVSFELFVRPALQKLSGARPSWPMVTARATAGWRSPAAKRQFVRAVLTTADDGVTEVRPVGGQGSHLLADLAEATCLAVVPDEVTDVSAGDLVRCILLPGTLPGTSPGAGMSERLTHLDDAGAARMVDVSAKPVTAREATATGFVACAPGTVALLRGDGVPKGDALAVARLAGIQAAKRTPELVPLAHPVAVHGVAVELSVQDDGVAISATVRAADRTGVEMEALTCVVVAGLGLIDMIKGVDRLAEITSARVTAKSGGRSGDWRR